jgi:pimeloyl-ACP methyl ester carboxylesterase
MAASIASSVQNGPETCAFAGRTAILIVHGVGQQHKYQTVADFAAGLQPTIERRTGVSLVAERVLMAVDGRAESVLRLRPDTSDSSACVDIVEYYYQPALQRRVETIDVVNWLVDTAEHIRKLYETNARLKARLGGEEAKTALGPSYMLARTAWLLSILVPLWRWLRPVGEALLGRALPFWFSLIGRLIAGRIEPLMRDFVGDVTAYTAIDPRLKLNDAREQILQGCVEMIKNLIERPGSQSQYDRVVVAGHSLGSVVAYDALSRIAHQCATDLWRPSLNVLNRLRGLVTFGSPLDKVALCFWPSDDETQAASPTSGGVRAQWNALRHDLFAAMLQHFHGMRGLAVTSGGAPVVQPSVQPLKHVVWLNFFHPRDIIAGSLDAFVGVVNIRTYGRDANDPFFPEAHSFYWYDREGMLPAIVDAFVCARSAIVDKSEFLARYDKPKARRTPGLLARVGARFFGRNG